MRQRLLIGILLVVGGLYALSSFLGNEWIARNIFLQSPPAKDEAPGTSRLGVPVLDAPPERMRDALREAYRVRPDARFLLAISEIHHLLSGKSRKPTTAVFENGAWTIRHEGHLVGTLPEYPDFPDAVSLLTRWVRTTAWTHPFCLEWEGAIAKPHPGFIESYWCRLPWWRPKNKAAPEQLVSISSRLDHFFTPEAAAAAREIDSLWRHGTRDAFLLRLMTRALVYMNLQVLDRMETGDQLPARALAVLALTKGLSGLPVTHEEALLAETMGYSQHAQNLGAALPDSDPVKWYVWQDDMRLSQIVSEQNATTEAKYLHLLRLATHNDVDGFLSGLSAMFPGEWLSLPIFRAGLEETGFAITRELSQALPRVVLLAVWQEVGAPNLAKIANNTKSKDYSAEQLASLIAAVQAILEADTSTLLNRFESGLTILDSHYSGPFLDSQTYQAYFRAHFFSGLYLLGLHYLDALSSATAVEQFAQLLGSPESGIALAFTTWYRHLSESENGNGNPSSLLQDIETMKSLTVPLRRSFDELIKSASFPDPRLQNALLALFNRLDSRADHLQYLGFASRMALLDLAQVERLYRSVVAIDAGHHRGTQAWHLFSAREPLLLWALFRSPQVDPVGKAEILTYLERLKADPRDVREGYEHLIAEFPDLWWVRFRYMEYLERGEQFAAAREVGASWLARNVATIGLERVETQTLIARMFYLEGRYEEGLDAIGPIVAGMKGSTLHTAALLLEKHGEHQNAERMALTCVERYPSSAPCRATLAELYWRHKKPTDAARILKDAAHPLNVTNWKNVVAPKFHDVFRDHPPAEILAAYSIMLAQGIDQFNLHRLAFPFAEHGRFDVAYELVSRLSLTPSFYIYAYSYLKQARTKDEALTWLRTKIPDGLFVPASRVFYAEHQDELLWEFAPLSDDQRGADEVWLYRAAAWVRDKAQNRGYRETLLAHYNQTRPGMHHTLGRILLELSPEQDVLVYATSAPNRCQIGYYLGLLAQSEGHYADASDWYSIAVQTQQKDISEHNTATGVLVSWMDQEAYLQHLANEKP